MSAHYHKELGRFDFCSYKKQWNVYLCCDDKSLNQTWPEDEEPEIDGLPPSEVAEMIAERWKRYLYRSRQDADNATLAYIRENAARLDSEWATTQIAMHQREIDRLRPYLIAALNAEPQA